MIELHGYGIDEKGERGRKVQKADGMSAKICFFRKRISLILPVRASYTSTASPSLSLASYILLYPALSMHMYNIVSTSQPLIDICFLYVDF